MVTDLLEIGGVLYVVDKTTGKKKRVVKKRKSPPKIKRSKNRKVKRGRK